VATLGPEVERRGGRKPKVIATASTILPLTRSTGGVSPIRVLPACGGGELEWRVDVPSFTPAIIAARSSQAAKAFSYSLHISA
jgi:hypothetical protein